MRFEILGPIRIVHDSEVIPVAGALRRSLLALLVAHANSPVPTDTLLEALWGRHPAPGLEQRLHVQIHRLRKDIGEPERVSFGTGGYRLTVLPGELDGEEFESLVDDASSRVAQDPQRCVEMLRAAVRLFRGSPYQCVDLLELSGEIQRYSERRLEALEKLYAAELQCGRYLAITGELTELTDDYPSNERFHELLMTALHRGGRQADALAVYQRARRRFAEELGLEPGAALQELERLVLTGENIPHDAPVPDRGKRAPAQLPTPPTGFVGRERPLAQLDATVLRRSSNDSAPIFIVAGPGGIGKTALALHWAYRARDRFPDGQLYVDLAGYGPEAPRSAADTLAGFLRALGVDGTTIPEEPSERASLLRSLLAESSTLLLLDNARTVEQVRPLLPATAGCVVLVTSRDPLAGLVAREGADRIELDQLTLHESRQLLLDMFGSDRFEADPGGMDHLIERCARLPIALRIAAEQIRFRASAGVRELIEELDDPRGRLDLLETSGDSSNSVRMVLSWSYRQLPKKAGDLFRLWGLHPGYTIGVAALAAMAGRDLRSTRRTVEVLQRAHLASELRPGTYVLHDILRAYAIELVHEVDDETTRHRARDRLYDYYLATAAQAVENLTPGEAEPLRIPTPPTDLGRRFSSYEEARSWLDSERANLVHIAEQASESGMSSTHTTDLSATLWTYFDIGSYHDDAHRVHSRALAVAQQGGDRSAEGLALRNLGLRYCRLTQWDHAMKHFEQALRLQHTRGCEKSRAATLNYLASTYAAVGRLDDAIANFHESVDLYRHGDAPSLASKPLTNLGTVYRRTRRYPEAEHCFFSALSIAEEAEDIPGNAHALTHLAYLREDTDRYAEALEFAHRAQMLIRTRGLPALDVLVLNVLGSANRRLGNLHEAIAHLHEALRLAQRGHDFATTALVLNGLAEAYVTTGATHAAGELFANALTTSPNGWHYSARYQLARAHRGLGDVHAAYNAHAEATSHWRQARDIYRDLDAPEADEIAAALTDSGP